MKLLITNLDHLSIKVMLILCFHHINLSVVKITVQLRANLVNFILAGGDRKYFSYFLVSLMLLGQS